MVVSEGSSCSSGVFPSHCHRAQGRVVVCRDQLGIREGRRDKRHTVAESQTLIKIILQEL